MIRKRRTLLGAMAKFKLVDGVGNGRTSACVMSAAGWLLHASENWSDNTPTVCTVLREYYINLNDQVTDDERKLLWPHAKKSLYTDVGFGTAAMDARNTRNRILFDAKEEFDATYYKSIYADKLKESKAAVVKYLEAFDKAIAVGSCLALAEKERQSHG